MSTDTTLHPETVHWLHSNGLCPVKTPAGVRQLLALRRNSGYIAPREDPHLRQRLTATLCCALQHRIHLNLGIPAEECRGGQLADAVLAELGWDG